MKHDFHGSRDEGTESYARIKRFQLRLVRRPNELNLCMERFSSGACARSEIPSPVEHLRRVFIPRTKAAPGPLAETPNKEFETLLKDRQAHSPRSSTRFTTLGPWRRRDTEWAPRRNRMCAVVPRSCRASVSNPLELARVQFGHAGYL
jgi:hypothetical protein